MRLGFYVTPEKLAKLGWGGPADIARAASPAGLALTFVDVTRPLGAQGPFDALVLKMTEQLVAGDAAPLGHVREYCAQHAAVRVLDPLAVQQRFQDRTTLCAALRTAAAALPRALQPRHALLAGADGAAEAVRRAGLAYPLLVKPDVACGAGAAHVMAVALGPEALPGAVEAAGGGPAVAQEYVNHAGRLYKVFAVGPRVLVQQRPSLPDLAPAPHPAPLRFDNQKPLGPQVAEWGELAGPLQQHTAAAEPSVRELEEAAAAVRAVMGSELFGVDVIAEAATGRLALIDANYFPSYRGCLTAEEFFAEVARILGAKNA
eukprot:m51a1_g4787 putative inositol-tetrakisphosphate 1-kinase (318) ;mRNA; r:64494-65447